MKIVLLWMASVWWWFMSFLLDVGWYDEKEKIITYILFEFVHHSHAEMTSNQKYFKQHLHSPFTLIICYDLNCLYYFFMFIKFYIHIIGKKKKMNKNNDNNKIKHNFNSFHQWNTRKYLFWEIYSEYECSFLRKIN